MDLQHFLILVFLLNVAVAKKRYQTVTCETRGNDITTAVFRAICPSGCANYSIYSLWGTKRYTGDSRICSAAIHYGKITDEQGGRVRIVSKWGNIKCKGSFRNGVQSVGKNKWKGRYFHFKRPQRCLQQDIVTSAPVYKTRCPRGCEYRMNEVLGTPTQYSSRSSVCSAAIHAGEINEGEGGIVTVYKVKPVPTRENTTWIDFYESSQRGWLESRPGTFFQSSFTFDVNRIQCSKDAVGINGSF
uniref:LCCL domain-containing protein n=1 Tax=Ciona intestinalis TaxID=7719 RepID=H2Y2I6_CIOIN